MTAEELADIAAAALVACRAAEDEAEQHVAAARTAKDRAVWSLVQAGWSYRRVAAELDISPARVGQLVQRARAQSWGTAPLQRIDTRGNDRDAYQCARHAQTLREEAYTGGRATERRAFYGGLDAPAVAEAEEPITWQGWISHNRQEQPA